MFMFGNISKIGSNKVNARAPPHTFYGKGKGGPGRSLYLNRKIKLGDLNFHKTIENPQFSRSSLPITYIDGDLFRAIHPGWLAATADPAIGYRPSFELRWLCLSGFYVIPPFPLLASYVHIIEECMMLSHYTLRSFTYRTFL